MNHPIISSGQEDIRIQIWSNHFPTLRQMPEGWTLEIKPDRMPLFIKVCEVLVAALVALVVIRQLV